MPYSNRGCFPEICLHRGNCGPKTTLPSSRASLCVEAEPFSSSTHIPKQPSQLKHTLSNTFSPKERKIAQAQNGTADSALPSPTAVAGYSHLPPAHNQSQVHHPLCHHGSSRRGRRPDPAGLVRICHPRCMFPAHEAICGRPSTKLLSSDTTPVSRCRRRFAPSSRRLSSPRAWPSSSPRNRSSRPTLPTR